MNFMRRGNLKKSICIVFSIVMLTFIIQIVELLIYQPIKFGVYKKNIDIDREYIICEYVEVTGFFWRIDYNNLGKQNKYVRFLGIDPKDICSNQILYGENTFVFYGEYVDNMDTEILKGEDYVTFMVKDWDIIKPIKRFNYFFKPSNYLYKNDFLDYNQK